MEAENRINEWIIRFIEGDCPDDGMHELLEWVRESPEHAETLFGMKDLYDRNRFRKGLTEQEIDAGWARIVAECGIREGGLPSGSRSRDTAPKPRRRGRFVLLHRVGISVAACIALVLAFTVSSHLVRQEEWIVVTNDTGSQDHLILPDGSGVWLYYGASISYPEHFEKNRRDIRLTGEAFFDVVADRTRPFVVETPLLEVEVLGTRFNLSASDEAAQVVLESGSVNLGRLEAGEVVRQVLLKPGEMAEVSSRDDGIAVSEVDLQLYLSWKDKYLTVRSQRLEDVMRMLSKSYNTTIRIADRTLCEERLSGRFDQRQPLETIFRIIDSVMPICYEFDGSVWTILPRQ